MSTPELLLSQVAISLLALTLYHFWMSRKKHATPPASALATPAAPIATPPRTLSVSEQIPPEILAVIAAAIAVALGQPYQIASVHPAAAPMPELNVWALEGRMEQFKSHKVR